MNEWKSLNKDYSIWKMILFIFKINLIDGIK